ncbi:MAG: HAD-IA family hydrolase [Burkholderiaceae bacterium]
MSKLVLFDFDGTLADTAPDLVAAANRQRERRGLPPLPYEALRRYATAGARGLLKAGLDMDPDHPGYESQREQFLADYEQAMTNQSRLFPGVDELLVRVRENGFRWGIVTNKLEYLAIPMVVHLGLYTHCAVTVGGDTAGKAKPHPEPLWYAAEKAGFRPEQCIYVGDDQRDIIAGKAAGMATVVAAYGYGAEDAPVHTWEADAVAYSAHEIWGAIERWAR